MKVKELIEKLQQVDQELEVMSGSLVVKDIAVVTGSETNDTYLELL